MKLIQPPGPTFYGVFLFLLAVHSALPALSGGAWDAALVDLFMAFFLIRSMIKNPLFNTSLLPALPEKAAAWLLLLGTFALPLLPGNELMGKFLRTLGLSLLPILLFLYFKGRSAAWAVLPATLWCGVFIPLHEEFMLLASYPLRLSAALLSALLLKICGEEVIYAGSSIQLPDLNMAITDACSGINQLDAFILIAYLLVRNLYQKNRWQYFHFAFIIPAIIAGNTFRIVLTVVLFRVWGKMILMDFWHTVLGYVQILAALILFWFVGVVFKYISEENPQEEKNA